MDGILERLLAEVLTGFERRITDTLAARIAEVLLEVKLAVEAIRQDLAERQTVKEYYTCAEVADRTGKKPNTIRDLCRLGRIEAVKLEGVGRGDKEEWRIPHAEFERYINHGPLPLARVRVRRV